MWIVDASGEPRWRFLRRRPRSFVLPLHSCVHPNVLYSPVLRGTSYVSFCSSKVSLCYAMPCHQFYLISTSHNKVVTSYVKSNRGNRGQTMLTHEKSPTLLFFHRNYKWCNLLIAICDIINRDQRSIDISRIRFF